MEDVLEDTVGCPIIPGSNEGEREERRGEERRGEERRARRGEERRERKQFKIDQNAKTINIKH